jgi:hypothetical protein
METGLRGLILAGSINRQQGHTAGPSLSGCCHKTSSSVDGVIGWSWSVIGQGLI